MIPRPGPRPVLLRLVFVALLVLAAPESRAGAPPVDTILRPETADRVAADASAPMTPLVYTAPRGDFTGLLDELADEGTSSTEGLVAQAAADSTPPAPATSDPAAEKQPDLVLPVIGGLVGGGLGFYGGAILGYVVTGDDDGELGVEEFTGLVTGAALGEMLGVSLGAHLGNAGKGSFGKTLLTAAVTGIAGWSLVFLTESGAVAALAGAVHLGLVVRAERREGARRIAERAATPGDR